MEEYKKCLEDYEISNLGNCRKVLKDGKYKKIKGSINNKGYRYFQLQRNGKRKNYLYHQLVATIFLGARPILQNTKIDIDHIDRNKLNNCVNNLRYITHKENTRNTDRFINQIIEDDPKKRSLLRAKQYALLNRELFWKKRETTVKRISKGLLKSVKVRR